ncbi:MAG TPA: prolyl aminopeptidase [Caulobacteraceae bacterium]|nr:prolyl aminopeptidase [Caulobacteraceae bacterium]
MLAVDDLHSIYWEESGAADGVPLIFLHGGPGGALGPVARQYFDPTVWRIVYIHQRGAGRSTPRGETRRNTTQLLISDLELVRAHLGIERWVVAGGSWGSTLALAYAQEHPGVCLALLLNGVFLGRQQDIDWFFTGSRDFFPEAWDAFVGFLPENERDDFFHGYARRILDFDPAVHGPAVQAWSLFEGSIAALVPSATVLETFQDRDFALSYARMNIHYFSNRCFLGAAPILSRMDRLADLPAILVHARYDLATAYRSAVELARAWRSAKLVTVADAGHSRLEPANIRALIEAQAELAERLTR